MLKILNFYKIVFLLLLFGGNSLIYSQESKIQETKIDVLVSGGNNIQLLDFGDSKQNVSSYIVNFGLSYNLLDGLYLKTGVNLGDSASLNDFSFNSYQIPLLLGFYIFPMNTPNFRFFTEFGPHLRGIYNFKDFSEENYQEKESFGIIFNTGMHFDVNKRFFSRIYLNTNKDFGDSFVSDNNKIRMMNHAIMIGLGLKF